MTMASTSSLSPPEPGIDDSRKKHEYNKDDKNAGDSSGGEEKAKKIGAEAKQLSSWTDLE
jgi:hypothetical protein